MSDECDVSLTVKVARLTERVRGLEDRMERSEESIDRAVQIARNELERRLDVLNHAHQQSMADRAQYVTRAEMRWLIGIVVIMAIAMVGYLVSAK